MLVPLSVQDVMTRDVVTIGPDADGCDAARKLRDEDVGSLVVCDGEEPVGIVTESMVVDIVADDLDPHDAVVREFMAADLVTIGPEATLEQAARTLQDADVRRLPVVEEREDGDRLVGIVSTTDLSYFLPHLTERIRESHASPRPPAPDEPDREDWRFEFEDAGSRTEIEVGDLVRFRKELDDEDVRAFAEASGDTNPLHLDEEFAAGTRFGGRIAHGVLTLGVVSAALARLPGLVIYLGQDMRFLGPAEVGEAVTAVCEVIEDLGEGRYQLSTTVYDSDGERVIDGEAVVLVEDLPEGSEEAEPTAAEA